MKAIYFDNNSTTMVPDAVVKSICRWINKGNPSAGYKSAKECRGIFSQFRDAIATECEFPPEGLEGYSVVFTSGASESNAQIITSVARAFRAKLKHVPHIITSEIEHSSIILCCKQLAEEGIIEVTFVPPRTSGDYYGAIDPDDIANAIKPNTALITIMSTNNETGINNNIIKIGQISAEKNIPFHSDVVQLFGRSRIPLISWNIDAISVSFHKLYGPPGIGALIVRNSLIAGYDLKAIIYGTQNNGLRGGTLNTPAVAGAYTGFLYTLKHRDEANSRLRSYKTLFMSRVSKAVSTTFIDSYREKDRSRSKAGVVWISPKLLGTTRDIVVPWTIFMAVDVDNSCNVKIKNALERKNIIVSIGSACHTDSAKASHVVYSLQIPKRLRGGIIRVSFGYSTKKEEVEYFADEFIKLVKHGDITKD